MQHAERFAESYTKGKILNPGYIEVCSMQSSTNYHACSAGKGYRKLLSVHTVLDLLKDQERCSRPCIVAEYRLYGLVFLDGV